jgi:hypothetical protein
MQEEHRQKERGESRDENEDAGLDSKVHGVMMLNDDLFLTGNAGSARIFGTRGLFAAAVQEQFPRTNREKTGTVQTRRERRYRQHNALPEGRAQFIA